MRNVIVGTGLTLGLLAGICLGQILPVVPATQGATTLMGPLAPLDANAAELLKMLQDRGKTLQDFTADIDYSVAHPLTLDEGGKIGTLSYVNDPTRKAMFMVKFDFDTDEKGIPNRTHHQEIIFDGVTLLTMDETPKEFTRSALLPPGAKPGDAVSLQGPLTLPIGLEVEDVHRNFEVKVIPNAAGGAADQATLRLVPRSVGKFDFTQLDVTIDKKLELPVQLIQTAQNRDVTTIKLTKLDVNSHKAHVPATSPPTDPGWTEKK